MSLLKSIVTLASTPVRCLGELGKDLETLVDDRKDETKGILTIATLGTSSVIKGVVKSIKKAGEELDEWFNTRLEIRETGRGTMMWKKLNVHSVITNMNGANFILLNFQNIIGGMTENVKPVENGIEITGEVMKNG